MKNCVENTYLFWNIHSSDSFLLLFIWFFVVINSSIKELSLSRCQLEIKFIYTKIEWVLFLQTRKMFSVCLPSFFCSWSEEPNIREPPQPNQDWLAFAVFVRSNCSELCASAKDRKLDFEERWALENYDLQQIELRTIKCLLLLVLVQVAPISADLAEEGSCKLESKVEKGNSKESYTNLTTSH